MNPEVTKLAQDFINRFGDKAVWQVDTFILKLAEEIYKAGVKEGESHTPPWLAEALNSGDGTYRP